MKQTKNEITREFIKKELAFYNKADIRSRLLLGIVLALLSVPLVCLCIFLIDHLVLRIVLSCLCALLPFGVFALYFIYQLIGALGEKKMIADDQFEITTRKVLSMDEKVVGNHTETFFCFGDFKEISVSNTIRDFFSVGDEFYIVHYCGKGEIKLFYPTKTYELK